MGTTISLPDSINVEEITKNTGLTRKQIAALWMRFQQLDRDVRGESKGYLDADDLRRVPKFDANPIASRLTKVIFDDFGTNGQLTFEQFVQFMSTFGQGEEQNSSTSLKKVSSTTKTDLESTKYSSEDSANLRKKKFIFRMYDIDHDGRLSKEDIVEILKMMVGKINGDEALIIAEKVLAEFTENQPNSTVTIEDFEETLKTLDFNDKMSLKLLK